MRRPWLFWDVDTQIDFMSPDGRLYVPGAEEILPNLERLSRAADLHGVAVVASACDHEPSDPEISEAPDYAETFPPHCLRGTEGARRVPQTSRPWTLELGHEAAPRGDLARAAEHPAPAVLLHKKQFDVFTNPNTDPLLQALDPGRVAVYGVALDVCNRAAVEGLLARGRRVVLVRDATRAIDEKRGEELVADWRRRGVEVIGTEDVVAALAGSG